MIWRRGWDSNPRYGFPYTRFPSVRLKPLGHLSTSKSAGNIAAEFPVTTRGHALPCAKCRGAIELASWCRSPSFSPEYLSTLQPPLPSPPAAAERFRVVFVVLADQERGEAGGRHGSWAIVMAPRNSDPDHYFDMGAWRPARLILPSEGSSVASAY
jgi:hypothetical protein